MASITDCVVEGLKYPFNDIKKLLGLGVLFALISALSTYISVKSFDIFRATVHLAEKTNAGISHLSFSQLPTGDIYLVAGLGILAFIVSLFILGYQYNIIKFSIEKKDDLPGFSDVLGMFINGIKYFLVIVAYNIIPSLVLVGGVTLVGDSSAVIAISLISALLFIIANLVIVYMIIMVAVSFVLSFVTVALAATISNQAIIISFIIAIIEGLFVDSYGALFYNRVCGSIYRESVK